MHHTLLRPDPPQLRICVHIIPSFSHIREQLLCILFEESCCELVNGSTDDIVAAADGEGHAVPCKIGVGGEEGDVGGRVVAICVPVGFGS